MAEKKYAMDIFKVLEKLNQKDRKFFEELPEEDLKSIHPLVLMRWMSGVADARQVYFLNELVNSMVFPLTKHKQLLLKLLMISGPGKYRRYNWTKAKGKSTSNTPKSLALVKQHYGYSTNHAIDALKILSNDAILQIAEDLGKQPEEVREISKELKGRGILVDE
jgi:hypothetical protein